MSNVLWDVQYIPPKDSFKRRKKTQKRLHIDPGRLHAFAESYNLSNWETDLVKAVDIDGRNFSHIARAMGCTRQYVNQEYSRIYNKVIESGYSPA